MKRKRRSQITKKQRAKIRGISKKIETWKKYSNKNTYTRKKYNDIMLKAESKGILTSSGKISTSKKKYKDVEEFIKEFNSEFGSYSKFKAKQKKRFAGFKEVNEDVFDDLTFDEYEDFTDQLNDLYRQLFDEYDSDDAREVVNAYEHEPTQERLEHMRQRYEEMKYEAETIEKVEQHTERVTLEEADFYMPSMKVNVKGNLNIPFKG